jgi:very-short-patch-repair endonuclease
LPVPQYEVRDDDGGLIARVDFAYPEVRLAIEVDGYAHHSSRKQWESDLARQNRLIAAGWRVLRFSSRDVNDHAAPAAVERVLTSGEADVQMSNARFPKGAGRS